MGRLGQRNAQAREQQNRISKEQAVGTEAMRLSTEFVKLPLTFDAQRLAAEVANVPEDSWRPHPQGHPGNSALPLLATNGDPLDDAAKGPMRPTPHLARLPYLEQVLASLEAPIGRTRLMRLDANADATAHADVHYYWAERLRVHVPLVTTPRVAFLVEDRIVHMAPGECWVFDTWRIHNVVNPDATRRIHLVADTVGSPELWRLIDDGERPFASPPCSGAPPRLVPFRPEWEPELPCESSNLPVVMTPWEQAGLAADILADVEAGEGSAADKRALAILVDDLRKRWRALWALHGDAESGWKSYSSALAAFDEALDPLTRRVRLANHLDAAEVARHWLVRAALSPDLATTSLAETPTAAQKESPPTSATTAAPVVRRATLHVPRRFERPVFIVCPPRSGSSLLFETLAQSPSAWTIGGESHAAMEQIPGLHPQDRGWESNRLDASSATAPMVERLTDAWFLPLLDRDGRRPAAGAEDLRLLEKTPKNALRVPFLAAAFPDALFVYLYRHPREAIASSHEAWRSGRFVTYPQLPRWTGPPWSLLLVPGWPELIGRPLTEIAARQWATTTEILLADLEQLPPERWCIANYGRLVAEPQEEIERLCGFLGLEWDRHLSAPLPLSRMTLSPPRHGKWRSQVALLAPAFPFAAVAAERALTLFARQPEHAPLPSDLEPLTGWSDGDREPDAMPSTAPLPPDTAGTASAGNPVASPGWEALRPSPTAITPPGRSRAVAGSSPLRSVSTASFAALLRQLGSSLLISTYQSGRVVVVRADGDGEPRLNTHFRSFPSPMGMAFSSRGLAIGTARYVWEYRNVPAAARRVPPAGKHDSCFVPRACRITGDVRVHELAWAGDELWLVNTRFSCLASLDADHSFVPRWRPPFVSALAPEDRCHLNGLAVRDGAVRFATALGATDSPAGWREGKAAGGVLIAVPEGALAATGLSMPHSPRWHDGRLWVLESGKGEVGIVDLATGRMETVAQLPGFTRGLAFAGPFAFVGLSQVRESVFGGLPLGERLRERVSGVWVLDTRSGQTAGFLRFEDAVQEIFEVTLLPGLRFPELTEPDSDLAASTWVLPEAALAEVPDVLTRT
jgi:uncharacterized protein (TIGR03032 family)